MNPTEASTSCGTSPKGAKKLKKTSAYRGDFERHLADNHIYMPNCPQNTISPKPNNLLQIEEALKADRPSLPPSSSILSDFDAFCLKHDRLVSETDVMMQIVPILYGDSSIPTLGNAVFTNMQPIANEETVRPQPDVYDGSSLDELSKEVRDNPCVEAYVIPTKHPRAPIAPNLFLEVKGRKGDQSVAQLQACYDGAYGARAMSVLQNLNKSTPAYDGNAYTYSCVYDASGGLLQMYTHHITCSARDGPVEYRMTRLRSLALMDNAETFRLGIAAFRNLRELAQKQRNNFIALANAGEPRAELVDDGGITPNHPTEFDGKACPEDDTMPELDADDT